MIIPFFCSIYEVFLVHLPLEVAGCHLVTPRYIFPLGKVSAARDQMVYSFFVVITDWVFPVFNDVISVSPAGKALILCLFDEPFFFFFEPGRFEPLVSFLCILISIFDSLGMLIVESGLSVLRLPVLFSHALTVSSSLAGTC